MGALDDAIREHLELKRMHGASEGEVARKEKEALETGALPPGAGDAQALPTTTASVAEVEPEQPGLGEPVVDAEPSVPLDEEPDASAAGAPEPPPVALPDELEPDEVLPEESLELEPSEIEPAFEQSDSASDWADADRPNGSDRSDDLLEETPDFLEDMPEQDRLWFEQKRPKDFDFGD